MFPDTLCSALTELHADAPAHSWKITKRTVEEALCIPKGRLLEVFQSFEREPVASGSIAQIHRLIVETVCHLPTNFNIIFISIGIVIGQQRATPRTEEAKHENEGETWRHFGQVFAPFWEVFGIILGV